MERGAEAHLHRRLGLRHAHRARPRRAWQGRDARPLLPPPGAREAAARRSTSSSGISARSSNSSTPRRWCGCCAGSGPRRSTSASTPRTRSGCSHHQKIVVIDDRLAACGGIDIAADRWDTPEHLDDDPHRIGPDGKPYRPWHDTTMLMQRRGRRAIERAWPRAVEGRDARRIAADRPVRPGLARRARRSCSATSTSPSRARARPMTTCPKCARSRRSTST